MNATYDFAIFYANFIADLLQKPHAKSMHELLLAKKARSDKELLALYQANNRRSLCLNEIKTLRTDMDSLTQNPNPNLVQNATFVQKCQFFLLELVSQLPEDLIKMIGAYSQHVKNQKSLVRIEFYDNWFKLNRERIVKLLKGWSKTKLAFVIDKIRSPSNNNPYYNCCKKTTAAYKKGTELMFRSRIETLIVEKGNRSHLEQYSLLLAIEKYNGKK
jgi:hypothetical protein